MKGNERGRWSPSRSSRAAGLALLVVAILGCFPSSEAVGPGVAAMPLLAVTTREQPQAEATSNNATSNTAEEAPDRAAIVVVLDGARWQEIFEGTDPGLAATAKVAPSRPEFLMPHLYALLGSRGAALGAPD